MTHRHQCNRRRRSRKLDGAWLGLVLSCAALPTVQAGPEFGSPAWINQKVQTPSTASTGSPALPADAPYAGIGAVTTPEQARVRAQLSMRNLSEAARRIAEAQAAQSAAVQQIGTAGSGVPNGLVTGGLQPDADAAVDAANPAGCAPTNSCTWLNAELPVQTAESGRTLVTVEQTDQNAILTWESFNVGAQTTLHFDQTGGQRTDGRNDWIALNRVNDPTAAPSQIFGQIQAEGSIYLINQNGVLFGAGSQVDTHSLLVSSLALFSNNVALSNSAYLNQGLVGIAAGTPALLYPFGNPGTTNPPQLPGNIDVEPGATIRTGKLGYSLLAAPQVSNAGTIVADDGQAILAAAIQIIIPAPTGSGIASTRLAPVSVGTLTGPVGGVGCPSAPSCTYGDVTPVMTVSNTGIIQAERGDVTMLGSHVVQDGVAQVSSSLTRPGTITLTGSDGTTGANHLRTVVLNEGSTTAVLPSLNGEKTTSSALSAAQFNPGGVTVSGDAITLAQNALVVAPGAVFSAFASLPPTMTAVPPTMTVDTSAVPGRVYVDSGAIIDVSGLADVQLPIDATLTTIPRIGLNELADSPVQRDGALFRQTDFVIDSNITGVRDDGTPWVGSPMLNAQGYVDAVDRTISPLLIDAGSITLTGTEVITAAGSSLRLDGGYLHYAGGDGGSQTRLLGTDGLYYSLSRADPMLTYLGVAGEYGVEHSRWNINSVYVEPLTSGRLSSGNSGYIRGGNAGTLGITAANAVLLAGELSGRAFAGRQQIGAATLPVGGMLNVNAGTLTFVLSDAGANLNAIVPGFDANTPVAAAQMLLSGPALTAAGLSGVSVTGSRVDVGGTQGMSVQPGGSIVLTSTGGAAVIANPGMTIGADLIAPGGSIAITSSFLTTPTPGDLIVAATLSVRGRWVNDAGLPIDARGGLAFIDAGSITLTAAPANPAGSNVDTSGSILLLPNSVLDASSGGYVSTDGTLAGSGGVPLGRGGSVALATYQNMFPNRGDILGGYLPAVPDTGRIELGGTLLGYGFAGGGTLSLRALDIQVGGSNGALEEALVLRPEFFATQGFGSYNLSAAWDVAIPDGVTLNLTHLNLIPTGTVVSAPTGADLYDSRYTHIGQLDAFHRGPTDLQISAGDFFLRSNTTAHLQPRGHNVDGSVTVGEGASINADPGSSIVMNSVNQLTVLGSIVSHGGSITLSGDTAGGGYAPYPNALVTAYIDPAKSVWLGARSRLDVSGVALIDPLATIPAGLTGDFRQGRVLDGGQVVISNDSGFVVAESGAEIDASGFDAVLDFVTAGPASEVEARAIVSDGGSITLGAAGGLYFDATLRAAGGTATTAAGQQLEGRGGALSIGTQGAGLGRGLLTPGDTRQVFDTTAANAQALILQQSGNVVPVGLAPGEYIGGQLTAGATLETSQIPSVIHHTLALPGMLYFAVDRLQGSGIGAMAIAAPVVAFSGDVAIGLEHSFSAAAAGYLALPAGSVRMANGALATSQVAITAPYVSLGGSAAGASAALTPSTLTITASQGIDLWGRVGLQGFTSASFNSGGDLRFHVPAAVGQITGYVHSPGALDFSAARIYPASGTPFAIVAGTSARFAPCSLATCTPDSGVPLSAGGSLRVNAPTIQQDGSLYAPVGSILLGVADPSDATTQLLFAGLPLSQTQSVTLGPESMTSVSAAGQLIPFGRTTDGDRWFYGTTPFEAPPSGQLLVYSGAITLQGGGPAAGPALIDLRGCSGTDAAACSVADTSDLQASEWAAGTGGTRDVLSQYNVAYVQGLPVPVPLFPDERPVYAIIPGYGGLAPYDPGSDGRGDGVLTGQSVYLSGIADLQPGYYTLLPAQYATLPGAYRLVQDTAAIDSVPDRNVVLPDGSYRIAGHFADGFSGREDSRATTFLIQSLPVWRQYSEYAFSGANAFFSELALASDRPQPVLPRDGGLLSLGASQTLALGAQLLARPGAGGAGGAVDIAVRNIQIVGGATPNLRADHLQIPVEQLNALGATSLLIGGTRARTNEGDVLTPFSYNVVLSNDANSPLQGPEILLLTKTCAGAFASACDPQAARGVQLDNGAVLQAVGTVPGSVSAPIIIGRVPVIQPIPNTDRGIYVVPLVSGDGALVRVSNGAPVSVTRRAIAGVYLEANGVITALPAPAGLLTLGDGSNIGSASSNRANTVLLDSSGDVRGDPGVLFAADHISANSSTIRFLDAVDATPAGAGMVISPATQAELIKADSVELSSASDIIFDRGVTLAMIDAQGTPRGELTLNAARIHSTDPVDASSDPAANDVSLVADRIVLTNQHDPEFILEAAAGTLTFEAGELVFGSGPVIDVYGFGTVDARASRRVMGEGDGGFVDFWTANVNVSAPLVAAGSGSDTTLFTQGALGLTAPVGSTPDPFGELGGTLALLGGGGVTIGTTVAAPAGVIRLTAFNGPGTERDLVINGEGSLIVHGAVRRFFDVERYAPGGVIELNSTAGDIIVADGAMLDFSGATGELGGGDAGSLSVAAPTGQIAISALDGTLLGGAEGARGGSIALDAFEAVDLTALADTLAASGINDRIAVRTRRGNLELAADRTIVASSVSLIADGRQVDDQGRLLFDDGIVEILGDIDASGSDGGRIELIGSRAVIVEGRLLANATDAVDGEGGDVFLATGGLCTYFTDGVCDVVFDALTGGLGYQRVARDRSGDILFGTGAVIDVGSANLQDRSLDGTIALRVPLLEDGSVRLFLLFADPDTQVRGAREFTVEPYAVWSTTDRREDPSGSTYFNGAIDPLGNGAFYGSIGTSTAPTVGPCNAANCTGTLLRFVKDFDQLFVAPAGLGQLSNLRVRPGIELRNEQPNGAITVTSTWNLGAALLDCSPCSAGNLGFLGQGVVTEYAYRTSDNQAPILTLRAGDVTIGAAGGRAVAITDGFVQLANPQVRQAPQLRTYAYALALYQRMNDNFPALAERAIIPAPLAPDVAPGRDEDQVAQYYGSYVQYLELLLYGRLPTGDRDRSGGTAGGPFSYRSLAAALEAAAASGQPIAPAVASALDPRAYPEYLVTYNSNFLNQTTLAAPDAPPSATPSYMGTFTGALYGAVDNTVSPGPTTTNPFPLAAAALMGAAGTGCRGAQCTSTSIRIAAGADFASAAPMALIPAPDFITISGQGNGIGNGSGAAAVGLPSLIRTGSGSIELAGAGLTLQNQLAPGAIYTAGYAAPGLHADTDARIAAFGNLSNAPSGYGYDVIVSGAVHPVGGGDLRLQFQFITGQGQRAWFTGTQTHVAGSPHVAQTWWQWMQTGNIVDRSLGAGVNGRDAQGLLVGTVTRATETSINFGAFDQNLMSAGGDISIETGGDIVNLSVSLPTTWYLSDGGWTVVGGGDLDVRAGGDIISGDYFVSRGTGRISADGGIGTDGRSRIAAGTPISTLLAVQDAQLVVSARRSVDIGGIYNPSYVPVMLDPTPGGTNSDNMTFYLSSDSQPYSASSAVSISSLGGRLDFGTLSDPAAYALFEYGAGAVATAPPAIVLNAPPPVAALADVPATDILPASLSLTALQADISINKGGQLYPSPSGDLEIVAGGSINFVNSVPAVRYYGPLADPIEAAYFGMIDADPANVTSPLLQRNAATAAVPQTLLLRNAYIGEDRDSLRHSQQPLHATDEPPARIYALGDITNGRMPGGYSTASQLKLAPNKPTFVRAGRDIVNLYFVGQHARAADVTVLSAGRDIRDDIYSFRQSSPILVQIIQDLLPLVLTPLRQVGWAEVVPSDWTLVPQRTVAGPGSLVVEAGRNVGPFVGPDLVLSHRSQNQPRTMATTIWSLEPTPETPFCPAPCLGEIPRVVNFEFFSLGETPITGIATVGDAYNPYLPPQGADVVTLFGVGPELATQAFVSTYIAGGADGVRSFMPDAIEFVQRYVAGRTFTTGLVRDVPPLPEDIEPELALSLLAGNEEIVDGEAIRLPEATRALFAYEMFFKILQMTAADYNNPGSPHYHEYARGYQAIDTLFPPPGYTRNELEGGISGAAETDLVRTGNLDLRGTSLQTQRGGDITILGPGGRAILGSTAAAPLVVDANGQIFAGPSTQGVLTLQQGDISIFLDGSLLLAQSRVFTEQGGDVLIWSSNGDINAGRGARTATEIPAPVFECDPEHYCAEDARGKVTGAGIATLQTIPGAPPGDVYLIAPRGTVDAGEGGIRVSGNLVVAAFAVANADNIQVQGTVVGVPSSKVDVGALNAGSAAAAAAQQQAAAMARQTPPARAETLITVDVLGFGDVGERRRRKKR